MVFEDYRCKKNRKNSSVRRIYTFIEILELIWFIKFTSGGKNDQLKTLSYNFGSQVAHVHMIVCLALILHHIYGKKVILF